MSFDQIRNKPATERGKCALCKKKDRKGTVNLTVRDKDTKVVASRSIGVCEECGSKAYSDALALLTKPTP